MIDAFLEDFANAVGPFVPTRELPIHLKLIRLFIVLLGISLAVFGVVSIPSALAGGGSGPGLWISVLIIPMAFQSTWLVVATMPFALISGVVGLRMTMAPGRLRAAAIVCLGWAVVSMIVSVAPLDARVLAAVAMILMAGSLLNAERDPGNTALSARHRAERSEP